MNTNKILFIIYFLFMFSIQSFSQNIENVDFTVKDNIISITYDLNNCPSRELYDIKFTILNEGKIITPNSFSGDLRKNSSGKNKKVNWDVLADKEEIKGKIQVVVEISKTYSTKITGGPSNAFLSILLPGLGDKYVNTNNTGFGNYLNKRNNQNYNGNGYWGWVSFLYLSSVGITLYSKLESDNFYSQYHSSNIQTDMDKYYGYANSNNQVFYSMIAVTGAIWLSDVLYVTIKGFENKHQQLQSFSQNRPNIHFYFAAIPKGLKLGLIKQF